MLLMHIIDLRYTWWMSASEIFLWKFYEHEIKSLNTNYWVVINICVAVNSLLASQSRLFVDDVFVESKITFETPTGIAIWFRKPNQHE